MFKFYLAICHLHLPCSIWRNKIMHNTSEHKSISSFLSLLFYESQKNEKKISRFEVWQHLLRNVLIKYPGNGLYVGHTFFFCNDK